MSGIEKEVTKSRAGQGPAETKVKIVRWTILPTRLDAFHFEPPKKNQLLLIFFSELNKWNRKGGYQVSSWSGASRDEG